MLIEVVKLQGIYHGTWFYWKFIIFSILSNKRLLEERYTIEIPASVMLTSSSWCKFVYILNFLLCPYN